MVLDAEFLEDSQATEVLEVPDEDLEGIESQQWFLGFFWILRFLKFLRFFRFLRANGDS